MEEYYEGLREVVVILDLRWEMDPILDYDRIFGVGIQPLRNPSSFIWYCLHIGCFCCDSWNFLEVPLSETRALLERLMIGR